MLRSGVHARLTSNQKRLELDLKWPVVEANGSWTSWIAEYECAIRRNNSKPRKKGCLVVTGSVQSLLKRSNPMRYAVRPLDILDHNQFERFGESVHYELN